jgi:hypothetical protein
MYECAYKCGFRSSEPRLADLHEYEKHDQPRWDGRSYTADPACVARTWHHNGRWCVECRGYA